MAYQSDPFTPVFGADGAVDSGLRAFLGGVYLKLAAGLVLSAVAAWCVADDPNLRDLFFVGAGGQVTRFTIWGLAFVLAPLALLLLASGTLRHPTARGSGALYWSIAALVGSSMGLLVLTYTGASLVSTFLMTAAAFGGLSLWGYATKRNLTALGNFMVTALCGLIVAMLINLFLRSPGANLVINLIGVFIFAGLIAADTQRLKMIYYQSDDPEMMAAASNYGALTLYLNFINLFELLLSFSRSRSRR